MMIYSRSGKASSMMGEKSFASLVYTRSPICQSIPNGIPHHGGKSLTMWTRNTMKTMMKAMKILLIGSVWKNQKPGSVEEASVSHTA